MQFRISLDDVKILFRLEQLFRMIYHAFTKMFRCASVSAELSRAAVVDQLDQGAGAGIHLSAELGTEEEDSHKSEEDSLDEGIGSQDSLIDSQILSPTDDQIEEDRSREFKHIVRKKLTNVFKKLSLCNS